VKQFYPESFDRILLDPPCSALGLRPKLKVTSTLDDLLDSERYQKRFVQQAVALIKPGGIMTYSTCTFHCPENEGMVRHILDEYPSMQLLPIDIPLGSPGLIGHGLSDEQCAMVRRFDPTVDESIGFFVAKFQKATTSTGS
jgi:16S rRNA C967 or C1407 C5-methylase (RsmB/RsmF family)